MKKMNSKMRNESTPPGEDREVIVFSVGDIIDDGWGDEGTVVRIDEDDIHVYWNAVSIIDPALCTLVESPDRTVHQEVEDLFNTLVSRGHDKCQLLKKQVAQLINGKRGNLTRSECLQACAMLQLAAALDPGPAVDLDAE